METKQYVDKARLQKAITRFKEFMDEADDKLQDIITETIGSYRTGEIDEMAWLDLGQNLIQAVQGLKARIDALGDLGSGGPGWSPNENETIALESGISAALIAQMMEECDRKLDGEEIREMTDSEVDEVLGEIYNN